VSGDPYISYFKFLDELRESGAVNMHAAPPLLAEAFGLTPEAARAAWMLVRKSQLFVPVGPICRYSPRCSGS
jgi:hypothetical protein